MAWDGLSECKNNELKFRKNKTKVKFSLRNCCKKQTNLSNCCT